MLRNLLIMEWNAACLCCVYEWLRGWVFCLLNVYMLSVFVIVSADETIWLAESSDFLFFRPIDILWWILDFSQVNATLSFLLYLFYLIHLFRFSFLWDWSETDLKMLCYRYSTCVSAIMICSWGGGNRTPWKCSKWRHRQRRRNPGNFTFVW